MARSAAHAILVFCRWLRGSCFEVNHSHPMNNRLRSSLKVRCLVFVAISSMMVTGYSAFSAGALVDGAFPTGTPVTPYLIGQNYWFFRATPPPVDLPLTAVQNSGVKIIRIGGRTFDNTPLPDAVLLQQVDRIRSIGAEPIIQVSRHHGAATAANTVQFINVTNARNVKFWSIGNEPDFGFVGSELALAQSIEPYIKQISPAMRDVDPSITILGAGHGFFKF